MGEKLGGKIFSLFGGSNVIDIDSEVAVVIASAVETDADRDRKIREEIERKKQELGPHYAHSVVNRIRRLDGRDAHYKPSQRAAA
jgi:hypothetical protein